MREIGVRDLKASLSEVLRSVAAGDQVRVTVRGEAVADIVPAGRARSDERLNELIAEGRITPASAKPGKAPPLLPSSGRSASEVILAERDDER